MNTNRLNWTDYWRNSSPKNKNGQDYEPESLRVMIAALDRHLKDKQYPLSNVKRPKIPLVEACLGRKSQITTTGRSRRPKEERRRSAMEGEQVRKYNSRSISKHNVVVTYPVYLASAAGKNNTTRKWMTSSFAKTTTGWSSYSSCDHWRADQNPTRRLAHKAPRFSASNVCRWWRNMPSSSF